MASHLNALAGSCCAVSKGLPALLLFLCLQMREAWAWPFVPISVSPERTFSGTPTANICLQACECETVGTFTGGRRVRSMAFRGKQGQCASVISASLSSTEGFGDVGLKHLEEFCDLFAQSLSSETFVKATLSQNKGGDKTLTNAYLRLVSLKAGVFLQVKRRHKVPWLSNPVMVLTLWALSGLPCQHCYEYQILTCAPLRLQWNTAPQRPMM